MLIFLDSEFTDFAERELISIALVSEDGQHEFYAERTDYAAGKCNDFVRETVLPLLGRHAGAACGRHELTRRLWAWFATLPRQVQIAGDSTHDRELLWDAFGEGLPANLKRTVFDLRPLIDTTVFNAAVCRYHEQPGQPWHHALHDARAHRAGWMAWMADRSRPEQGFLENDPHMAQKNESRREFAEKVKSGEAKPEDASMFHGEARNAIVKYRSDEY